MKFEGVEVLLMNVTHSRV